MGNQRWFESNPPQVINWVHFQLFKKNIKFKHINIYKQLTINNNFIKRSRKLKFSFLFFFLIKKKTTIFSLYLDFFFFNNLYLLFFKKIQETIHIYKNKIVFLADIYCNAISRINDLNFFCNKNMYIYFKLKKYSLNIMQSTCLTNSSFIFLFITPANTKYVFLNNYKNVCPLINFNFTPTFFNFFLPTLINYNFSIFFYKYLFFNFIHSI